MDDFLEACSDPDFMFFIDDLDHVFQLKLIHAQYNPPLIHTPPVRRY